MKKKNIVCLGLMVLYFIFGFESVFAGAGDWVMMVTLPATE